MKVWTTMGFVDGSERLGLRLRLLSTKPIAAQMQQKGQVFGYARASSRDQHLTRQVETPGEVDKLFSGQATGTTRDRPGLTQLLNYVREGATLRVTSMDRLARDPRDLQRLVDRSTLYRALAQPQAACEISQGQR